MPTLKDIITNLRNKRYPSRAKKKLRKARDERYKRDAKRS